MSTDFQKLIQQARHRASVAKEHGDTVDQELALCVDALCVVVETLLEEDE